jgi:GNAT superfamily N-acetyltransferase
VSESAEKTPPRLQEPSSDQEIRWIARRYEEIGAASIPGYAVTKEGLEEAEKFIRAQILDENWNVVVAITDDCRTGSVGMLLCHVRDSPLDGKRECSVDAIHIEESHRGTGLGRILMEHARRWGSERGARRIRTFVAWTNAGMRALCRSQGYAETFVELGRPIEDRVSAGGDRGGHGAGARGGNGTGSPSGGPTRHDPTGPEPPSGPTPR